MSVFGLFADENQGFSYNFGPVSDHKIKILPALSVSRGGPTPPSCWDGVRTPLPVPYIRASPPHALTSNLGGLSWVSPCVLCGVRLHRRVNTGDGIPFAYDLDDDFKDLQFYCLVDGTIVEAGLSLP